ncbi:MAG: toxin-antitoxin system, antitoxin component, Xre family [Osedax symbiont Rs2]|nr:MAG: toxin-antitoxin system, antitoxin component, Xre family [Osedax symbiont Rs2]
MLTIGKTVKEFRLMRNLSLNDISSETGLNKSYLSKIENEKRDPSIDSLSKISKAINIPLNILILMSEEESNDDFSDINNMLKTMVRDLVGDKSTV